MLPRNLRQLYVHSYQSFLWNHVASRRMAQQNSGSFYAQPGDLYYNDKDITVSDNCADGMSFVCVQLIFLKDFVIAFVLICRYCAMCIVCS
ncbi:tRNA pseudouridine13 synthase [Schistosoma japonicum]|nr:tRNA pseudouridine13 synthase [Schistosoma japonicum]